MRFYPTVAGRIERRARRLLRPGSEERHQAAPAVERYEIVVAADMKVVDVDLRHRPPSRALHHRPPHRRIEIDANEVDFVDALGLEVPFGLDAVRTGRGRVHRYRRRGHFSTGNPASFHARYPPRS